MAEWQILLESLRESQFRELATLIEEHIAAGRSIPVEERKSRGHLTRFEPIEYFKVVDQVEGKRPSTKYDLQVVPFTDAQKEQIVINALRVQFVSPELLVAPIKEKLSNLNIGFASPVEPDERVSLREYAHFLEVPENKGLDESIREHSEPS